MSELGGAFGVRRGVPELLDEAEDLALFAGSAREIRELCDAVVERAPPRSFHRGRALLLRAMASAPDAREADLRAAIEALDAAGEPDHSARARLALGELLDGADARAELERAGALFAERGDDEGRARVALGLARLARAELRPDASRRHARDALRLLAPIETRGARASERRAHELLGDLAVDPREAIEAYRRALELGPARDEERALREKIERLRARRGPFR